MSAWIHQGDGLVGWGEAARLTLPAGEDRFAAGEKWLAELFDAARVTDEVGVPGTGPVAFGSFTFDPASDGSVLIVPAVIIGRRSGVAWQTTITAGGAATASSRRRPVNPAEMRWSDGSLSAPQWEQVVSAAVARIKAGELQKVVLARDLQASARRRHRHQGPACPAGGPLPRLLHVRLRRPRGCDARAADPAGGPEGQLAGTGGHDGPRRQQG